MSKDIENEIAGRDKVIDGLGKEIEIMDELIMEQKIMRTERGNFEKHFNRGGRYPHRKRP